MHVQVNIECYNKSGVYVWDKSARAKDVAVAKKFCPVHMDKQPYLFQFEIYIIIVVFHFLIFKIYFLLL